MITDQHRALLAQPAWTVDQLVHLAFLCRAVVAALDDLTQRSPASKRSRRRSPAPPVRAVLLPMPEPAGLITERLAVVLAALDGLSPPELVAVAARIRSRLEYAQ